MQPSDIIIPLTTEELKTAQIASNLEKKKTTQEGSDPQWQ